MSVVNDFVETGAVFYFFFLFSFCGGAEVVFLLFG